VFCRDIFEPLLQVPVDNALHKTRQQAGHPASPLNLHIASPFAKGHFPTSSPFAKADFHTVFATKYFFSHKIFSFF
jgi:hypothetical protein